jgi:PAS domain S-box-containing protein
LWTKRVYQGFAADAPASLLQCAAQAATQRASPYIHTRTVNGSSEAVAGWAVEAGSRRAQFFAHLPVACYACDCAGIITDFNRRAVELWGREPLSTDRFTGAHRVLDTRGDPIPFETTATAFLLRSGLSQINREVAIEKPDGRRITVLSNVAPLLDENANVIGALDVLQDITDQRSLEDARRVAERINAFTRVALEVAQLKPALHSMAQLLDSLGREATLSVEARGFTELAQLELVRFDALVRRMSHLSGVP